MLGRVFCLLSLIESKKLFDFQNNEESVTKTFKELFKLSRKKSYLSSICFHGVGQIIQHVKIYKSYYNCFKNVLVDINGPFLVPLILFLENFNQFFLENLSQ